MIMTIEADEGPARWGELLAAVEAGNDVVIARGDRLLAKVAKLPQTSPEDVDSAISSLRENRKSFAPITVDEIIAWKNEGRR